MRLRFIGACVAVAGACGIAVACGSDSDAHGSSGTGGDAGAAGAGPGSGVAAIGEPCAEPGALACAGNFQEVGLICGADGTWEVNTTCSGDQICDTRAGTDVGTCQDQDPNCLGRDPGTLVCFDDNVYECGVDNITVELVGPCDGVCTVDGCQQADPCPTDTFVNCANDCGGRSASCDGGSCPGITGAMFFSAADDDWPLRTPAAEDACACPSGRRFLAIQNVNDLDFFTVRVTVSEPWYIVDSGDDCGATVEGQCAVRSGVSHRIVIATDDPTALPRNVVLDPVPDDATCP